MSVTAKFRVESITTTAWNPNGQRTVRLVAVSGPENKPWSEYTPSGNIEMAITNPAAFEQFELGKVFILTFEEVPQ